MNILVTGATGNIGQRFVPRLLQQHESVRILVRNPELAKNLEAKGAKIAIGDITDATSLTQALKGIDVVIHLAAFFRSKDEEEIKKINIDGTKILAEAAIKANVKRFIFASTGLVYGGGNKLSNEASSTKPDTIYPRTKIISEKMLLELAKKNLLDVRIVRFAFVYGDGDPHISAIFPMVRNWLPMKRLQTVHHADIAQALIRVMRADGINGQIYNVADDAPLTIKEIFTINGQEFSDSKEQNENASFAWENIMDTTKIRKELGYTSLIPSLYKASELGLL